MSHFVSSFIDGIVHPYDGRNGRLVHSLTTLSSHGVKIVVLTDKPNWMHPLVDVMNLNHLTIHPLLVEYWIRFVALTKASLDPKEEIVGV